MHLSYLQGHQTRHEPSRVWRRDCPHLLAEPWLPTLSSSSCEMCQRHILFCEPGCLPPAGTQLHEASGHKTSHNCEIIEVLRCLEALMARIGKYTEWCMDGKNTGANTGMAISRDATCDRRLVWLVYTLWPSKCNAGNHTSWGSKKLTHTLRLRPRSRFHYLLGNLRSKWQSWQIGVNLWITT